MPTEIYIPIPAYGSASWKDPVATFADLPINGNSIGDVRVTEDTDVIYIWTGTAWQSATVVGAVTSLNGLSGALSLATGTSGSDFGILPFGTTITLNLPTASASNRGALSSADWSTFNSKQDAGNYITGLNSDVSASGPGLVAATVNSVGGSSALSIHTGELRANAATAANIINTIVARDTAGNFSAGTITANLTGNVSGTASSVTGTNVISNSNLAQMAALTIKGNNTGVTANAANLTATQVTAMLNVFTSTLNGLAPLSGGGTSNFLRADGTWATPPVQALPLTTKGDIFGFSTINARIPVGTNNQVLTADSTQTLGVKWATPSAPLPTILYFGNGQDGNVTISSGTTTLSNDMYYNNLTMSGTGKLVTNGYFVFIAGILDLTNAPVGAIQNNGANGGAGTALGVGGSAGGAGTSNTLGAGVAGGVGGTGNVGAGGNGGNANSGNQGSYIGDAGSGGDGAHLGGGGSRGATAYPTNAVSIRRFTTNFLRGASLLTMGSGASGGGGGTGDNTVKGGGGGGGGAGGNMVFISAATINRSSSTSVASTIQAMGGSGGAGGTPTTGQAGGGGGGGGASGGWVYVAYGALTGTAVTGLIDVSGGNGGAGGNGTYTGGEAPGGGSGGGSGSGGRVVVLNLTANTGTENLFNSNQGGNFASGTTGGATMVTVNTRVNL